MESPFPFRWPTKSSRPARKKNNNYVSMHALQKQKKKNWNQKRRI